MQKDRRRRMRRRNENQDDETGLICIIKTRLSVPWQVVEPGGYLVGGLAVGSGRAVPRAPSLQR